MQELRPQLDAIMHDPRLKPADRNKQVVALLGSMRERMQKDVVEESKQENSPYFQQVQAGARGSETDLNSLRGADMLVTDQNDNPMPVPMLRSYGEGLSPVEFFAATYGQRKGAIGTKLATADAGFYTKKIVNAAHRQVITKERPDLTRLPVGLPMPVSDKDNVGAVLAHKVGGLEPGTLLTHRHLRDLEDQGVDEILIHSPMTENSADGGISQWAAGKRTRNGLSAIGDNVGVAAGQAIGERLSQGTLNTKHAAGVSGSGHGVSKSGFEYLNRLTEGPEEFPEAGPLVHTPGAVEKVEKAPQGGHYIHVAGHQYYAHPGVNPTVKPGDAVGIGDDLTDGVPHPADLVKYRGLGEARRVYLSHMRDALKGSGVSSHRRNLESVVAGLMNWGQVTDHEGMGDHVVDDVVPYGQLSAMHKPRQDAQLRTVQNAADHYLEEPALHYTVGTRVTPQVQQKLTKFGVKDVLTHAAPPPFQPYFQRGIMSVYNDPDWQTQQAGFYTASAFQKSLWRGADSDPNGTSYVPALARGKGFGENLATAGTYGAHHA